MRGRRRRGHFHQTRPRSRPRYRLRVLEADGERWIIAESRLGAYEAQLGEGVQVVEGSDGRSSLLASVRLLRGSECVSGVVGDFVSTEDGTGIVHMAPGFGEEDQMR